MSLVKVCKCHKAASDQKSNFFFTQEGREKWSTTNFQPIYFIRITIYPAALPHNISRGHYLPCKIYSLVLACIKTVIPIRLFSFAMV